VSSILNNHISTKTSIPKSQISKCARLKRLSSCSLILVIMMLSTQMLFAKKKELKASPNQECTVCHINWHPENQKAQKYIVSSNTNVIIDGKPSLVADRRMCLSCHDGYVMDSREIFFSDNHQHFDEKHMDVLGFPLTETGDIYCGTCHTLHAIKGDKAVGPAPFIREAVSNSKLCIACHTGQQNIVGNHPYGISLADKKFKLPPKAHLENETLECLTCHQMHGPEPTLLSQNGDYSELCTTCHAEKKNIYNSPHDLRKMPDLSPNNACAVCHLPHGGKGKYLWAMGKSDKKEQNEYCLDCHNANGLAAEKSFVHKGHPVTGKVFKKDIAGLRIKAGNKISCLSCHDAHQPGKPTYPPAPEEPFYAFLKIANDFDGALCTTCHENEADIKYSDHSVARSDFADHLKSNNKTVSTCNSCHNMHNDENWKYASDPICLDCHTESDSHKSYANGGHPLSVTFKSKTGLPVVGDTRDRIGCVTCHNPHAWGSPVTDLTSNLDGDESNSFLRIANTKSNLCMDCHESKAAVFGSPHDLGTDEVSTCATCHAIHQPADNTALINPWKTDVSEIPHENQCLDCHSQGGAGEKAIPQAWKHPKQYLLQSAKSRGDKDKVFPLYFDGEHGDNIGAINCYTCHNPHEWSSYSAMTKADNPQVKTSFLRQKSSDTYCADCHGKATLWKYNYFHDPDKRGRY
jgi:predicted CXXCH cytochrome family protein